MAEYRFDRARSVALALRRYLLAGAPEEQAAVLYRKFGQTPAVLWTWLPAPERDRLRRTAEDAGFAAALRALEE